MLEQDYLKNDAIYNFKDDRLKQLNEFSSQLIRELIIPKLTKEVNTSKKYATLRQIYYSLILAQWFKTCNAGRNNHYSSMINRQNLSNLTSKEYYSKDAYFKAYQQSFKDGEYNFQTPVSTPFGQVIRSYFSGGFQVGTLVPQNPGTTAPTLGGGSTTRMAAQPGDGFLRKARNFLAPILISIGISTGANAANLAELTVSAQEKPPAEIRIASEKEGITSADQIEQEKQILTKLVPYSPPLEVQEKIKDEYRNALKIVRKIAIQFGVSDSKEPELVFVVGIKHPNLFAPAGYLKGLNTMTFNMAIYESEIVQSLEKARTKLTFHFLLHELFHANSCGFPAWFLDEGVTEYLTNELGEDKNLANRRIAYRDNLEIIDRILWWNNNPGEVKSALLRAYFAGDSTAITELIGKEKWETIMSLINSLKKAEIGTTGYKETLRRLHNIFNEQEKKIDKTHDNSNLRGEATTGTLETEGEIIHALANLGTSFEDALTRAQLLIRLNELKNIGRFPGDVNLAAGRQQKIPHGRVNNFIKDNLPQDLRENPANIRNYRQVEGYGVRARVIPIRGLFNATGQFAHIGLGQVYGEPVIYVDADYAENQTVLMHELYEIAKWEAKREELGLMPQQMRQWILDNFEEARQLAEQWHNDAPRLDILFFAASHRMQGLLDLLAEAAGLEGNIAFVVEKTGPSYAFVNADGKVRIVEGLFDLVQKGVITDKEFAALLAHEIAHLAKDDAARKYILQKLGLSVDEKGLELARWIQAAEILTKAGLSYKDIISFAEKVQAGVLVDLAAQLHWDFGDKRIAPVQLINAILRHQIWPVQTMEIRFMEATSEDYIDYYGQEDDINLGAGEQEDTRARVISILSSNLEVYDALARTVYLYATTGLETGFVVDKDGKILYGVKIGTAGAIDLPQFSEDKKAIAFHGHPSGNILPSVQDIWGLFDITNPQRRYNTVVVIWGHRSQLYMTVCDTEKINSPLDLNLDKIQDLHERGAVEFYALTDSGASPLEVQQVKDITEQISRNLEFYKIESIDKWTERIIEYYRSHPELHKVEGILESIIAVLSSNTGYSEDSLRKVLLTKKEFGRAQGKYLANPDVWYSFVSLPNQVFDVTFILRLLARLNGYLGRNGLYNEAGEVSGTIKNISKILSIDVSPEGTIYGKIPHPSSALNYAVQAGAKSAGSLGVNIPENKIPTTAISINPKAESPGGIDFRSLPIVTQAIGNLSAGVNHSSMNRLASVNLPQEWSEIERMVNAGITPSAERIKEYVQASCAKGETDRDLDKIISCISDILRQEEERCCQTEATLRDILVVLEASRSSTELSQVFLGKAI